MNLGFVLTPFSREDAPRVANERIKRHVSVNCKSRHCLRGDTPFIGTASAIYGVYHDVGALIATHLLRCPLQHQVRVGH